MDLSNATIIFTEVMMAKAWDKHAKKINTAGMMMLAKELGKSIRQTIKIYTGVDMRKVFNLSDKEKKKAEKVINKLMK